jgi:gliding motility-associated-like protein
MRYIHTILFAGLVMLLSSAVQAQTTGIKLDTVGVPCPSNSPVSVPVRLQNFNQVIGLQFTVTWNPSQLQFQGMSAVNAAFANGNIVVDTSVATVAQGRMTFVWIQLDPVTVPFNTPIFSVNLLRLSGGLSPVTVDATPNAQTALQILNSNVEPITPVNVFPGAVRPIDDKPPLLTCPANLTVSGSGAQAVNGIAPVVTDNCGLANTGWSSTGATIANFPSDGDASGFVFSPGPSTVTYIATDVAGNSSSCSFTIEVQNNGPAVLTVIANNATASCDDTVFVDITVANFNSVGGLQFSLNWDETLLEYVQVSDFNQALNLDAMNNFGVLFVQDGSLSFNWSNVSGVTLGNNSVLFTVALVRVGSSGNFTTPITFTSFPTPIEAYDGNINPIPYLTVNGQISVTDTEAPNLTCPNNVTVAADPNGSAAVNNVGPTFGDNCSNATVTYTRSQPTGGTGSGNASGVYQAGTTTVTYTAVDGAGNTNTCAFTVNVSTVGLAGIKLDSVNHPCTGGNSVSIPVRVFNFQDIIGLSFPIQWDPAVLSYQGFGSVFAGTGITAGSFPNSGILAPTGALFFVETTTNPAGWPNIPDGGILFTLNFTILDPNGTTTVVFGNPKNALATGGQIVGANFISGNYQVIDNTPPVITCPVIPPVQAVVNCQATVNLPFATATDACGAVSTITNNGPSAGVFNAGTTQVTYTATDAAGNTATCNTPVTVIGNTNLSITNCPTTPIVVEAIQTCSAAINYPQLTAVNPCVTNANFNFTYNIPPGTIRPVGVTTVTATATQLGNGGGFVTCTFTVQVVDGGDPQMTCPDDITVTADEGECTASNLTYPQSLVTDNCSTNLTATINDPSQLPIGTSTLTYSVSDAAGNTSTCQFEVTVVETEAPTLNCPSEVIVNAANNACSAVATWAIPTASDNCTDAADLILTAEGGEPGNTFPVGVTEIIYTATDLAGNAGACFFNVIVLENVPPVIQNCPAPILLFLPQGECETDVIWTAPTATDNCGVESVIPNINPGTVFQAGTTEVIYLAFDFAGNADTCMFEVTLRDPLPPVFTSFPNDISIENASPCGAPLNIPAPVVTDNCDPNPAITFAGTLQDTFPVGTTIIEFTATDASGNSVVRTLSIVVSALQNPGFINCPNNQLFNNNCTAIATWTPPGFVGSCEEPDITTNFNPNTEFQTGIDTVIYTATFPNDPSIYRCSFTITVQESQPPTINCPQPIVVSAAGVVISDPSNVLNSVSSDNCTGAVLSIKAPTASDNCESLSAPQQISGPGLNSTYSIGTQTLVFQATDASGNTATCSFTVSVEPFRNLLVQVASSPACEGDQVTLSVLNIPGASYAWSGPESGYPNASTLTIQNLTPARDGQYSVRATLNGCTADSDTATVVLATQPTANDDAFNVSLDSILTGNVRLNDVADLPADVVLQLLTPLNGLQLNADGTFSYQSSGESGSVQFIYELCSETCDKLCDQATVTITISDNACNKVPNIFTPNNDGTNDYFEIECLDSGRYPSAEMVIYNQWGDKVFESATYSNDPAIAWNGGLNNDAGTPLPDGVYYYIFIPESSATVLKGFIQIFR